MELLLGGTKWEPSLERVWKNLLVGHHHDIRICGLLPDARKFLITHQPMTGSSYGPIPVYAEPVSSFRSARTVW
jgi:hypothetical protein